MNINQHVVPYNGIWAVKNEQTKQPTSTHKRKTDAVKVAKKIAKEEESELIIHDKDGNIQKRENFGK